MEKEMEKEKNIIEKQNLYSKVSIGKERNGAGKELMKIGI